MALLLPPTVQKPGKPGSWYISPGTVETPSTAAKKTFSKQALCCAPKETYMSLICNLSSHSDLLGIFLD